MIRSLTLSFLAASILLSGSAVLPLAHQSQSLSGLHALAETSTSVKLPLEKLDPNDKEGFTLKTVRTNRSYYFTKPAHWDVKSSSNFKLTFQHSAALLEERSSLNVLMNNRIIKTIPLGKGNVETNTVSVPIPPEYLKERNTLTLQVDQHYTYECEDPFSEELWTMILPESELTLNYANKAMTPDLTQFPYPFFDELGHGPTTLGFVAPGSLSDESKAALATVSSSLGGHITWHPTNAMMLESGKAMSADENIIVVGTPSENPMIAKLGAKLPLKVSGSGFSGTEATDGVLQVIPHPAHPHRAVLIVSGGSPEGVAKAAHFLSRNPVQKLVSGPYAIIKDLTTEPTDKARAWDGWVTKSGQTLGQLGFSTQTARGVTALPIIYTVKRSPDLFLPGKGKLKIATNYSYASQIDNKQSKLEVKLNGKTMKSIPLDNPEGETNARAEFDIPVTDFFTFNDLEFQFYLYPDKLDLCKFVTDAHIWGTIHNNTSLDFPSEVKTPLPDVGLINDAGYPFTNVPDLSKTLFVLPDSPSSSEMNTFLQISTRLGKESPTNNSRQPEVASISTLTADQKNQNHLVLIGSSVVEALKGELNDKYRLVIDGKNANLKGTEADLATVQHNTAQGVLEEIMSPYNDKNVVLLAYGETDGAQARVAELFKNDKVFGAIQPGNLTVINDGSQPTSVTALKKGDARMVHDEESSKGLHMPVWLTIILGFFAAVGLITLLGLLFKRR